jgi:hypothetical protein
MAVLASLSRSLFAGSVDGSLGSEAEMVDLVVGHREERSPRSDEQIVFGGHEVLRLGKMA